MTKLSVNRKVYDVGADGDTPLLWVIRDDIGLTGTKFGCGVAQCGACTIHVDGEARSLLKEHGIDSKRNTCSTDSIVATRRGYLYHVPRGFLAQKTCQC